MWAQLSHAIEGHRSAVSAVTLAVVAALVVVSWEIDAVKSALTTSGLLQLLILAAVLDVSATLTRLNAPSDAISGNTMAVREMPLVKEHIARDCAEASILAFTGLNALPLARDLIANGWTVRLLVRDPKDPQAAKISAQAEITIQRIMETPRLKDRISLRLYTGSPGMHGLLLPSVAVIGWFNYRADPSGDPDIIELSSFPMICVRKDSREGFDVWQMMASEFEKIWISGRNPDP